MAEETLDFQLIRVSVMTSGNVKEQPFRNLLDSVLEGTKIFSEFQVVTSEPNDATSIETCNYLFYLIADQDLEDPLILEKINAVGQKLVHPRQHLFVVLDTASELSLDDDDEMILTESKMRKLSDAFEKKLVMAPDDLFHYLVLSVRAANIWSYVIENGISELSDRQVEYLAQDLVRKAAKLPMADKRRELKTALKTLDKDRKLMTTGYTAFETEFSQYLRMINQKLTVVQNILYQVSLIEYPQLSAHLPFLEQVFKIKYLKDDTKADLLTRMDANLNQKAVDHKIAVTAPIKPGRRTGTVDLENAHERLANLQRIHEVISSHLPQLAAELDREIRSLNKAVTDQRCREVENVTDLSKVGAYLASLKTGHEDFIRKIPRQTKIIQENLQNTEQWIKLIDECLAMGLERQLLIKMIKDVIIAKIDHYVEASKSTRADMSMTYPQCLNVFLLTHLEKDFVFKHLQMILTYGIRFSGRNLSDLIRDMTEQDYLTILGLEHKLLELVA